MEDDFNAPMDWQKMTGEMDKDEGTVSPIGFAAQATQLPPEVAAAHRPPATEEEKAQRISVWTAIAKKVETDPNLMRALGMAGAMLAQPKQPGQTNAGNLANAYVVGSNAYQMGQQAEHVRGREMRQEAREDTKLGFEGRRVSEAEKTGETQRGYTVAQTDTSKAALPGVKAEAEVKHRTIEDAVKSAGLNRQRLEVAVDTENRDAALKDLIRDNEAIKAFAVRPDIVKAHQQEIAMNDAKIAQLRGSTSGAAATERLHVAQAGEHEITLETLRRLPEAEVNRIVASKFAGHNQTSGVVQQAEMHRTIYKALPPDDPDKKGRTEDQYVATQLRSGKLGDLATQMKNYVTAMEGANKTPDPEVMDAFQGAMRSQLGSRPGGAPTEGRKSVTMAEVDRTAKARGVDKKLIIDQLKARGIAVE